MKRITPLVLVAVWLAVIGCGTSNASYRRDARDSVDSFSQQYYNDRLEATRTAEATRIALEDFALIDSLCPHLDENSSTADYAQYQACVQRIRGGGSSSASQPVQYRCISWTEASRHIGESTCVSGIVSSTYKDTQSSAFFIDFDNSRTSFYGVSFKWIWNNLKGMCVEISGRISTYNGRPQIVIDNQDQFRGCQR